MARRSNTRRGTKPPPGHPQPAAGISEPAGYRPAWRRHALRLLALWGLALLAYSNSFGARLIFDSNAAVVLDPRVHELGPVNRLILTQDYWYAPIPSGLYRPITTFSYLFNYAILGNGVQPAGYHWVNLALHSVNIALVYLLALLVFQEVWPAWAMAAIWSVHPVLTESVTCVVGRADLLAAFGVLAGLLCYIRGATAGGWRRILWLGALMAATFIGVFSKESGVLVIAAVLLWDLAFRRDAPWRPRIAGYLSMALPVLAFLVVRARVLSEIHGLYVMACDNPLAIAGFWTARLTAVKVLGKYLWLLLWPASLSCDYSYNQIPLFGWHLGNWEDGKTLVALAAYLGVAAATVVCYRRSKPVFFFLAFFLATLAPTANLVVPVGTIMAERFLYLPAIGFTGCVVWLVWSLRRRLRASLPFMRMVGPAALAVVLAALSVRTYARNFDWRDERTLWSSAAHVSPNSYKPYQNLAGQSMAAGKAELGLAIADLERSLAILAPLPALGKPAAVYASAGDAYLWKGDLLAQSNPATAAAPQTNPWYQKALDILLRGQEADRAWTREVARRSLPSGRTIARAGWPRLYLTLGETYVRLGESRKAVEALDYSRRIGPLSDFEEASGLYLGLGKPEEAAVTLLEGLAMDPASQTRLAADAVQMYRQAAPESCAINESGGRVGLNLGCPLVRGQLCTAYRNIVAMYREMRRETQAAAVEQGAIDNLGCSAKLFP